MKFLLIVVYSLICNLAFNQNASKYFILADDVNIRLDRSLSSTPLGKAELGKTYQSPVFISPDWIGFYLDHIDTIYINRKFIGLESDFLNAINGKSKLNGRAKYELLKIQLANNDFSGSKELLFDLLDNHATFLDTDYENCDQLNVLAFEMYFKDYSNKNQFELLKKVISEVKDANIKAIAYSTAIKYSIIQGQLLLGEYYIKEIITNQLNNLLLKGCDYSTYFTTSPVIETKRNIFVYFQFCGKELGTKMWHFFDMQLTKENSLKSDFCKDMLKILNDGNFAQHYEYKTK